MVKKASTKGEKGCRSVKGGSGTNAEDRGTGTLIV